MPEPTKPTEPMTNERSVKLAKAIAEKLITYGRSPSSDKHAHRFIEIELGDDSICRQMVLEGPEDEQECKEEAEGMRRGIVSAIQGIISQATKDYLAEIDRLKEENAKLRQAQ